MANPWTDSDWNLTAQGEVVRTLGLDTAHKLAKEAGTVFGGPRPVTRPAIRNYILTKRIGPPPLAEAPRKSLPAKAVGKGRGP